MAFLSGVSFFDETWSTAQWRWDYNHKSKASRGDWTGSPDPKYDDMPYLSIYAPFFSTNSIWPCITHNRVNFFKMN